MLTFKQTLTLLLAVSLVMAGFPVQAKPQCLMAAKMQVQQMDTKDMKNCEGCAKVSKQESQKKNGCCGDMYCAAKCSAMSNASAASLGSASTLLAHVRTNQRFYVSENMLASHILTAQERPPKFLS